MPTTRCRCIHTVHRRVTLLLVTNYAHGKKLDIQTSIMNNTIKALHLTVTDSSLRANKYEVLTVLTQMLLALKILAML